MHGAGYYCCFGICRGRRASVVVPPSIQSLGFMAVGSKLGSIGGPFAENMDLMYEHDSNMMNMYLLSFGSWGWRALGGWKQCQAHGSCSPRAGQGTAWQHDSDGSHDQAWHHSGLVLAPRDSYASAARLLRTATCRCSRWGERPARTEVGR